MKKFISCILSIAIVFSMAVIGMSAKKAEFDTSLPTLSQEDGWECTLDTDFSKYDSMEDIYENTPWSVASHGKRATEYWCDQNLKLDKNEGALVITSTQETNHNCPVCDTKEGTFTSCLETQKTDESKGFEQAYGYYEVVCKVPDAPGMWSAFWLQSDGVRKVGNKGADGSEIDVYESSFHQKNRTKTGSAIHYDAYSSPWYHCIDNVADVGYDLYDGQYHKFALHWSPDAYVFFVDDKPTWATNAGGVSSVPEFLKLSVEIRSGAVGPYGQQIGEFQSKDDGSTDFCVKSVKVWQNESYKQYINSEDDFKDSRDTNNMILYLSIGALCGVVLTSLVFGTVLIVKSRKNKKKNNK